MRNVSFVLLRFRTSQAACPDLLWVNSPGGDFAAGWELARMVRLIGVNVAVDANGMCASMCMLSYAAGKERFYKAGAHLGVHSLYRGAQGSAGAQTAIENTDTKVDTTNLARLMKLYGTPDTIIGKLVTTPGDQMAWLTDAEVIGWATPWE